MQKSSISSTNNNHQKNVIVDYRNGKYQGQISTSDRVPNGMGIFLNADYLLSLAFWKNGSIQGQFLTIYSNGSIFYGSLKNNQPIGMTCYQLANGKIIYCFINNSDSDLYCIDDTQMKTIVIVKSASASRNQFFQEQKKHTLLNDYLSDIKEDKKQFFRKNMQIVQQAGYASETQKWDIIQKYSKQIIKSQYKDYKAFIKFQFCNTTDNKLDLTQTKQELQFGFKKTSIICHISEDIRNRNPNKIKLVGFYDQNQKKMDIYRKVINGLGKQIQQGCQNTIYKYSIRPKQVKANVINYYKKSSNFINKFINIKHFNIIKSLFQTIASICQNQLSSKKAQDLLQMGILESDSMPVQRQKLKATPFHREFYNLQLAEVKNDVYNRVKRKRNSSSEERSFSKTRNSYMKNQIKLKDQYEFKQNYISPKNTRFVKYLQSSPSRHKKQYLKYAQISPKNRKNKYILNEDDLDNIQPNRSKSRKYTYCPPNKHQQSMNQFQRVLQSNNKYFHQDHHSRSQALFQNQPNYDNQQPSRFQPKMNDRIPQTHESIEALTYDYKKISNRLQKERSTSGKRDYNQTKSPGENTNYGNNKSPKKYSYLNQPTLSPTSASSKIKKQWR